MSRYCRAVDVKQALTRLRVQGWAELEGDLRELQLALRLEGLSPAASQRGLVQQTLRPTTQDSAPVNTMSAVYGLNAQPLHTDGAHLTTPPDVVVLYSEEPNATPTLVWSLTTNEPSGSLPEFAYTGIFTVRNGRDSFLASAAEGARLRYDPVCMSPADPLARKAAAYFGGVRGNPHAWDTPNKLLLINNRKCLHARDAVAEGDASRALKRLTLKWE